MHIEGGRRAARRTEPGPGALAGRIGSFKMRNKKNSHVWPNGPRVETN